MAAGKWEKSKFVGTELAGKTVGIVGLGQVGSRVASRARAFEARLLGHDPYLPAEKAREMGVPLVPLDELLAQFRRRDAARDGRRARASRSSAPTSSRR